MMIRNFDVRQKSTGDVIVRLGTPLYLLLFALFGDVRQILQRRHAILGAGAGQWNLRHLARVDRREQSGSRLRAGCSVLPCATE